MRKQTVECGGCRFYRPPLVRDRLDGGVNLGTCRRMPPAVVHAAEGVYRGEWPEVRTLDWCGEWAAPPKVRRGKP